MFFMLSAYANGNSFLGAGGVRVRGERKVTEMALPYKYMSGYQDIL